MSNEVLPIRTTNRLLRTYCLHKRNGLGSKPIFNPWWLHFSYLSCRILCPIMDCGQIWASSLAHVFHNRNLRMLCAHCRSFVHGNKTSCLRSNCIRVHLPNIPWDRLPTNPVILPIRGHHYKNSVQRPSIRWLHQLDLRVLRCSDYANRD